LNALVPVTPQPAAPADDAVLKIKDSILARLHDEAKRRVGRRHAVEQRWLLDLAQYHGVYDEVTRGKLKQTKGSTLFVNLTRPKTNAMTARLNDLLFPTDDRNWSVSPTPVPELTTGAARAVERRLAAMEKLNAAMAQGMAAAEQGNQQGMQAAEMAARAAEAEMSDAIKELNRHQSVLEEASKRAELMELEIDDALKASNYAAVCRDVIEDGTKIGTGVMKGPIMGERTKMHWLRSTSGVAEAPGSSVFQLKHRDDMRPAFVRVDPWGYFPDPDARTPEQSEDFYERHILNLRQLRRLGRRSDVDKDALRRLIKAGPQQGDMPSYVSQLHNVTGQDQSGLVDKWIVWEYTGALSSEEVAALARSNGLGQYADQFEGEVDPLKEINVRILYSSSELLSFGLHPLDSGEPLYSTFCLEKDETSPYGFGLPYLMRDDQAAYNAAWRMMMDNAGAAAGPQIIAWKDKVTPADGVWEFRPFKFWHRTGEIQGQGQRVFETFDVPIRQAELANIISIARQQVDDVTGMPAIAQGEQGTDVTKTAQGMALLMNGANVVFRRHVRNFDDDVTVPSIRRIYHFLMQFSDKEAIKGDFEVDARGSSVLLVREMQSQNLALIVSQFADHPVFGAMLKEYDAFREFVRSLSVPATQIMVSEQEYQENKTNRKDPAVQAAEIAAQQAEQDREVKREEIAARVAEAESRTDAARETAQLNYDAAMMRLAEERNMDLDRLTALLQEKREDRASGERKMAAEIAMKRETGDSAGGSV
jgi:hypothetical protein